MKYPTLGGAMLLAACGLAQAADMPLKAAPPPVGWTGCYFGVNIGGAWSDATATPGGFVSNGFVNFPGRVAEGQFRSYDLGGGGFSGGGQLGCNYQAGVWVLGAEADIQGTTLSTNGSFAFPTTAAFITNTQTASQSLSWIGTVRGRLGYLITPSWLVYGTGGLAYAQVDNIFTTLGVPNGFPGQPVSVSSSDMRTGWTAGAGMEYALTNTWTAKVEYLYYDLGSQTLLLSYAGLPSPPPGPPAPGNAINYNFTEKGSLIRVGLNLRF
jgi:outer membrane immunogenic protein